MNLKKQRNANTVYNLNPSDNIVKFNINKSNLEIEHVELFDISGKIFKTKLYNNNFISLKGFETGIYFVRLTFKIGNSLLKRIVKK